MMWTALQLINHVLQLATLAMPPQKDLASIQAELEARLCKQRIKQIPVLDINILLQNACLYSSFYISQTAQQLQCGEPEWLYSGNLYFLVWAVCPPARCNTLTCV